MIAAATRSPETHSGSARSLAELCRELRQVCEPFFFKTADRHEIDLVLYFGNRVWAVEIKLTTNPRPEELEQATRAAALLGADRVFVVSQVLRSAVGPDRGSCNLPRFLQLLGDAI